MIGGRAQTPNCFWYWLIMPVIREVGGVDAASSMDVAHKYNVFRTYGDGTVAEPTSSEIK
jgi:hypothetical protein